MIRYGVLLVAPLLIGSLVAIGVLLVNGLRERRERKRRELHEARRLERAPSFTDLATRSERDLKDRRIAS